MATRPKSRGRQRQPGNILSIDLASRRYGDFGFAFLPYGSQTPAYPKPADLGLEDPPQAEVFAQAVARFCDENAVSTLLLDGPQGWRHPASPIEHMRLCERVLNTPGKTGVPGQAKPATYLTYIQFSIDVFHHLRVSHGWPLLTMDWSNRLSRRWAVETYPSVAWSLLGMPRLPSRVRVKELAKWRRRLQRALAYELPSKLSHDQIQATIVLPAGTAIATGRQDEIILAGVDPLIEKDTVFEGLIVSPRIAPS